MSEDGSALIGAAIVSQTAPMNFFHWDGRPLLDPRLLDGADRSCAVELETGKSLDQPGAEDYEGALRAAGRLGEAETLVERPDLVAAAQAHWHAEKCNSCIFSAYLSSERLEHGWESFVVLESGPAGELGDGIEEVIAPRLSAPATEIVSVILPQLDDSADLAALISHLGRLPDWSLIELGEEDDDAVGTLVRLGLRRDVQLDYVSEVLGFGPHPGAARTRLAPFTELAIRAKPPPRPKNHGRAVMTDVRLPDVSGALFGEWGAETAALRKRMLGTSHDLRGKAKVSFVVPKAIWEAV